MEGIPMCAAGAGPVATAGAGAGSVATAGAGPGSAATASALAARLSIWNAWAADAGTDEESENF